MQAIHRRGEGSVARDRTAVLRVRLWVSELAPAEEELKAGMPRFRCEVLQSKRLLVFRRMLEAIQHEDISLVDDMMCLRVVASGGKVSSTSLDGLL